MSDPMSAAPPVQNVAALAPTVVGVTPSPASTPVEPPVKKRGRPKKSEEQKALDKKNRILAKAQGKQVAPKKATSSSSSAPKRTKTVDENEGNEEDREMDPDDGDDNSDGAAPHQYESSPVIKEVSFCVCPILDF
jgi:hypothetical protein